MEVVEASEAPTMIQEKMCVVHEHPPEPPPETPEQKPTQSHASDDDHSDDGVSLLPRHTKVLVTGNNRTKSSLVGLRGVVKKAVGLGGWHWLVLSNGDEVRLQRNALSVLEQPTGEEEDDDEDEDEDNRRHGASSPEHHDSEMTLARSRPKRPRPCPAPVGMHPHSREPSVHVAALGYPGAGHYEQFFLAQSPRPGAKHARM
mmetsp:Transcript_58295/g.185801  ORF Transcript_58295/g.185801 Transcript_58295/m.185801 type:complete len:202 (-) Transcript_58295:1007-1612(-)